MSRGPWLRNNKDKKVDDINNINKSKNKGGRPRKSVDYKLSKGVYGKYCFFCGDFIPYDQRKEMLIENSLKNKTSKQKTTRVLCVECYDYCIRTKKPNNNIDVKK